MKINEAQSKNDQGKGKDSSKPESLNHKGNRKKPYDNGQKKTRFSDTSKSKDKDKLKRTYYNTEEALKDIQALLQGKCKRRNSVSDTGNPTTGGDSIMARLWPYLAGQRPPFGRRNRRQIPLMMRVLCTCLLLRRQKLVLLYLPQSY
jgi:hypothetical protein